MNSQSSGIRIVALLGGIVLMLILQLAILSSTTISIYSPKYQDFALLPFVAIVPLAAALIWHLERMPK